MFYEKKYFKSKDFFICDITPKRKVSYYEIEIYDSGNGCSFINNNFYPHRNNMTVFAKPSQERFTIGHFTCYAVHFSCGDAEICEVINTIPDCTTTNIFAHQQLLELYGKIDKNNPMQSLVAIGNILNIIKNQNLYIPNELTQHAESVMRIKEYIDNNYQHNIDLSHFQKIANLSINYIRKLFLDYYGMTIQKYINELRLSYVKKLLLSTDLSICDIAYSSGFNSQSHMNYMFKSSFGLSPLKYKKKAKKNDLDTI